MQGDIGGSLGEKSAVVQAAHEVPHGSQGLGVEFGEFGLTHEVLLQRGLVHQGVHEMLPPFSVLGRIGNRAPVGRGIVPPILVELPEDIELLGEIHLLLLVVGVRNRGHARIRIGGIAVFRLFFLLGGPLQAHVLGGQLLQGGIALELLLDDRMKVQRCDLEYLQGLAKLRRKDGGLRLSLAKFVPESRSAHAFAIMLQIFVNQYLFKIKMIEIPREEYRGQETCAST